MQPNWEKPLRQTLRRLYPTHPILQRQDVLVTPWPDGAVTGIFGRVGRVTVAAHVTWFK